MRVSLELHQDYHDFTARILTRLVIASVKSRRSGAKGDTIRAIIEYGSKSSSHTVYKHAVKQSSQIGACSDNRHISIRLAGKCAKPGS